VDYGSAARVIQEEIAWALASVRESEVEDLLSTLIGATRVFVIGAGRVGLASQAFAKRLMHLGLSAFYVGEVTTPAIGPGDLLLVCSGSGETRSICVVADLAAQHGADIATITREPAAHIAGLSKAVVTLLGSSEDDGRIEHRSVQPMTTLFEQSLLLLLDAMVLRLMERLGETSASMWPRHMNLE